MLPVGTEEAAVRRGYIKKMFFKNFAKIIWNKFIGSPFLIMLQGCRPVFDFPAVSLPRAFTFEATEKGLCRFSSSDVLWTFRNLRACLPFRKLLHVSLFPFIFTFLCSFLKTLVFIIFILKLSNCVIHFLVLFDFKIVSWDWKPNFKLVSVILCQIFIFFIKW